MQTNQMFVCNGDVLCLIGGQFIDNHGVGALCQQHNRVVGTSHNDRHALARRIEFVHIQQFVFALRKKLKLSASNKSMQSRVHFFVVNAHFDAVHAALHKHVALLCCSIDQRQLVCGER